MENYRMVTSWQSERALTGIQAYLTILPKEFRPDAVMAFWKIAVYRGDSFLGLQIENLEKEI